MKIDQNVTRYCRTFMLLASLIGASAYSAAYDNIINKMDQLTNANQGFVARMELGVNDQGKTIYGWRIANTVKGQSSLDDHRAKYLVVGVHHGNETHSADVATRFAEDIVQALKTETAGELAQRIFYVIPVLNIGGYNSGRREEYTAAGKSTDPNRDYPDPCADDESFKLASTKALADFVRQENIVGAVTIHGYIGTFTFPWGTFTTQTQTEDHGSYSAWAKVAAKQNGYRTGTHADVIYPTAGAFEDWAYYELGIWTMLLEVRHNPDIGRDSRALLSYFNQIPTTRSEQHAHLGDCKRPLGPIKARP